MLSALSFTTPFILIALASLPVIWWLLRATPPTPKTVRFPAFIILRQLNSSKETPDRTPWWLLLLRLLLAALVIIGLAGPILNAPTPSAATGPIMIVVDDSWGAANAWRQRQDLLFEIAAKADQSDREIFLTTTAPQQVPTTITPITPNTVRDIAENLAPSPFAADRSESITRLEGFATNAARKDFEVHWLSDGVANPIRETDAAFLKTLEKLGNVSAYIDPDANRQVLRSLGQTEDGPRYRIDRLSTRDPWQGVLVATARDGRELMRQDVQMNAGESFVETTLDLPLALRNELSTLRVDGIRSASTIQLVDARDRRALVGLISDPVQGRNNLLSGAHYLRRALDPYAEFITDSLSAILESDVSVIILDDVGTIRSSDVEALNAWVETGGVLIRFAGPTLAEAAQDREPVLLPVRLRGGGRAFGGALTWDTPQLLDGFPNDSPFSGLPLPDDVFVRQQVLAEPGGETTLRSWARLKDGTPLVTGTRQGAGTIALFHITATPQWSDLPASELFVSMLRRLTFLSALGPENADTAAQTKYPPLKLLDGFGQFQRPADNDPALNILELAKEPAPERRPGFYGNNDAPLTLNAISASTVFEPLNLTGALKVPYEATPPRPLSPPFFLIALILLLLDGLATLVLSGRIRLPGMATAMIALALTISPGLSDQVMAQPLDTTIDERSTAAALTTRLAYIETGDPAVDDLSLDGLGALSRELYRRTSIEPASPVAINLETDDLSVYPFLYWPIVPGATAPSDAALSNIENFMRFGGLILFDSRDDERVTGPGSTPEQQTLQNILTQLDTPPLAQVEGSHVLLRSFYLLPELRGRNAIRPVWVQANADRTNDGVTPLIIGGRDWAGAWATDQFGRPRRPMPRGGERARELSYRAGINMVMVALTGNYKSDQVHTPILLERLGQ